MAKDAKYGDVKIKGVPEDMPVFIILAKDKLSVPTVARYQGLAMQMEGESARDPEWITSLGGVIQNFTDWQHANPDQVKLPD